MKNLFISYSSSLLLCSLLPSAFFSFFPLEVSNLSRPLCTLHLVSCVLPEEFHLGRCFWRAGRDVLVHVTTIIVTQVATLDLKSSLSMLSPLGRCLTSKLTNVSIAFYTTIHVLNVKRMWNVLYAWGWGMWWSALQRIECLKSREKSNRVSANSAPNIFPFRVCIQHEAKISLFWFISDYFSVIHNLKVKWDFKTAVGLFFCRWELNQWPLASVMFFVSITTVTPYCLSKQLSSI